MLQQEQVIENLESQLTLCDGDKEKLKKSIEFKQKDVDDCIDANWALKEQLAKQRSWATVGKVGVGLFSLTLLSIIASQFIP